MSSILYSRLDLHKTMEYLCSNCSFISTSVTTHNHRDRFRLLSYGTNIKLILTIGVVLLLIPLVSSDPEKPCRKIGKFYLFF